MSLQLTLDANTRFQLEPGYRHFFPGSYIAQHAGVFDPDANHAFWQPPGTALVQLSPLQMHPEFLDHGTDALSGAIFRLAQGPLVKEPALYPDPVDHSQGFIYEVFISSRQDAPFISCLPATLPGILGPPTQVINGIQTLISIQGMLDQSQMYPAVSFQLGTGIPGPPSPVTVLPICQSSPIQQNQGLFFRWYRYSPRDQLVHQEAFALTFGQFGVLLYGGTMELFENVLGEPNGGWLLRARTALFSASGGHETVRFSQPNAMLGQAHLDIQEARLESFFVIPLGRQKILFGSEHGYFLYTVRAHPQRTADRQEWAIIQPGLVTIWGLSSRISYFQLQKLIYPLPAFNLRLNDLKMDYTPQAQPNATGNIYAPTVNVFYDVGGGAQLTGTGLTFPRDYVFAAGPLADDCPAETSLVSGQGRTFGAQLTFQASPDGRVSPVLYGVELTSQPVFMDNPATPVTVEGTSTGTGHYLLQGLDISAGTEPGEGRLTALIYDTALPVPPLAPAAPPAAPGSGAGTGLPPLPPASTIPLFPGNTAPPGPTAPYRLAPFYYRSEVPVQLRMDGVPAFAGYTHEIEVRPQRQTGAPVEMELRCNDRWLLLEHTLLREQRNWTHIGHISVVDSIVRQCGIDTGPLHWDGTRDENNNQVMSGGSLAEYPAGWDGKLSSTYNTPLGTPVLTQDDLEGTQLLGWKPQPNDTGAMFLERILTNFLGGNWVAGFRPDGTFYYLPYKYFTTPSVVFYSHSGRAIQSGGAFQMFGLELTVGAGTAQVDGQTVRFVTQMIELADNATNSIFLEQQGSRWVVAANTTGINPGNAVGLGTATTKNGLITTTDVSMAGGRQQAGAPVYRKPVEFRTIEPSGNAVQLRSYFMLDQTANRSAIYVDWASILNPQAPNYLGRWKWFFLEVNGAHSCSQLNWMAYQAFQGARRRFIRCSFRADFQPQLKIGQVFTLEGLGNYRLREYRTVYTRQAWEQADYVGEFVEDGF